MTDTPEMHHNDDREANEMLASACGEAAAFFRDGLKDGVFGERKAKAMADLMHRMLTAVWEQALKEAK